jgi:histidine triad (HIT) family protein
MFSTLDTDSLAAVDGKTTQRMARAVMKAFDADGVTIQQFNESAGGQVVFPPACACDPAL